MAVKPQAEDWALASRKTHKKFYSELDVLLKGVEKFFDPEIHQNQPGKNYSKELGIARDVCLKIQGLLESVMPESRRNAYWFQKFAEFRLMGEGEKDSFKQWMNLQDSPEKSTYLLYDTLINVKNIASELLKGGNVSYPSFMGVGQILSREIRSNRFYNPFRKEVSEFDVIENIPISRLVKNIPERAERRTASMVFLHLFRLLRYLGHMDLSTQRNIALHSNLLIILLLKPEIEILIKNLDAYSEKCADQELANILGSIAYQFSMEQKRVFRQELRDILAKTSSQQRGKIENSHGILTNVTEQIVISLAQYWNGGIKGEEIFEDYMTRYEQSYKLRDDIAVFHRLISILEKKGPSAPQRERKLLVSAIQNYMHYFESFTFRLLRYEDYEEFAAFFAELSKLIKKCEKEYGRLFEKCLHFKIYLETTLRHVANRAELKEKPLSAKKVDEMVKQYLNS